MAAAPDKKDKSKSPKAAGKGRIPEDFHLVRNAALIFAATLAVAGGLMYFSNEFMEQKQGELNTAMQQREEARQKLARSREEEREIREYLGLYQKLVKLKIVGEENRLDWIEALQLADKKHNLPAIAYEFSPRQVVQIDPSVKTEQMELRATTAKIKLELLHEGDLLALLATLRQAANDFFTTRRCRVERRQLSLHGDVAKNQLENRLTAECTVAWLTIGAQQATPEVENPDNPPPPSQ